MTNTLISNLRESFTQTYGTAPEFIVRAPGRVNLLGEHVDYNDGFVLPIAIDRAAYLAVRRVPGPEVTITAPDVNDQVTFRSTAVGVKADNHGKSLKNWARYAAGVAWSLAEHGLAVHGLQAVLRSDVPRGAGLSSSAAVEVAYATAWQALGGWSLDPMALARACQKAENQYVGVNSGIMDQFASACGQAGHALLLDCRSLEWQPVPLPAGVSVVVADTMARRELGASEYNVRRAQCEEAVMTLALKLPGVRSLRDVSPEQFATYAAGLTEAVRMRAAHVVAEIARTQQAVGLLRAGDAAGFGQLMNEGHASLRDLYQVSSPELDLMVSLAQPIEGCYGARLTGAGFGGCTVNLVASEAADAFARTLVAAYHAKTGKQPDIYVCQAAAGASVLS
jgi:galactokinase